MEQLTIEEIKRAILKADLALRPYMVLLHPDTAKAVKDKYPKIEDIAIVISSPYVDKDKGYLVNREETIIDYIKDF